MLIKIKNNVQNSNYSYYNLRNVSAILDTLENILTKKVMSTEHIIAFYKAQVELFRISIDNLHRAKLSIAADKVKIRAVDGMQGAENHLILLDVVATDATVFSDKRIG